jgi:hypothetical protein
MFLQQQQNNETMEQLNNETIEQSNNLTIKHSLPIFTFRIF